MREWTVTLPIAGHAVITVRAQNEEDAIEAALGSVEISHLEDWEALEEFNRGNVCYCPHPWEASAEDCGEVDD